MADEEHPNEREYLRDFDTTRTSLPIFGYRDELIRAVSEYPVLVVCGDTGSGKTTQLPQYLLETDPSLRIAVTQPRRIAAISAAQRVAAETGSGLGTTVGFCVRFETVAAPDSKIVYMTDGALLRRIASSSLADVADVVVLDEAHERSLETDLLFGILKERMASSQPRLRLIVMSATLDMDKFSAFFGDAPVFTVPGRMYPVHLLYAKRMKWAALKGQIVSKCVEAVLQIHQSQPQGDILVFLTGQSEIETCARLIATELDSLNPRDFAAYPAVQDLSIHPIYSALDTPDQKQVFRPARPG
ncbi:P-loop containing nucleoside triphosphate hydrolase protein, partial [Chytriomyces sp. MP71]